MSQITNEVAFKQATEFARQQDKTVQFWAGRYVVVQAGLAIAESALYTWNLTAKWIVPIVATLLAILSIILCLYNYCNYSAGVPLAKLVCRDGQTY